MYLAPKRAFSIYFVFVLVVIPLLGIYRPVQAGNTLVVDTTSDEFDRYSWKDGCSLREAIQAVYENGSFGGCQADSSTDTISVPAGIYELKALEVITEDNASGDLDIQENLTIIGAGNADTKIIAGQGFGDRIFHILGNAGSPTVRISGLEISGGSAVSSGGSGVLNQGATLYLDGVLVRGNANPNFVGGGIYNTTGSMLHIQNQSMISGNTGSYGGGIYNKGTVMIEDSIITDNTAYIDGGGLGNFSDESVGAAQISRSTFTWNHVNRSAYGAGISSNGRLTIENSVVENNAGIGLLNSGSNAIITGSLFSGNSSANSGNGAGIDSSVGTLTIQNSQIRANTGTGMVVKDGATVTIWKTDIAQNSGTGLRVIGASNVTVSTSSVTENVPANPSSGAGIASAGSLNVNYSTIANNAGPGLLVSGGTASLTNSTVGANKKEVEPGAPDLANSVGILSTGSLALNNSTIADHTGGGLRIEGGTAAVTGTLFARNGTANCTTFEATAFNSLGYNLRDQADESVPNRCLFTGNVELVDNPGLDNQLWNNGGYTQTYALLDNSPAVDAIDKTNPICLADDQRRFGRPANGNPDPDKDCDIGAFELGAAGFSTYIPSVRR